MEYSTFKFLQAVLFFGSAMGFCLWQLAVIRRMRREDEAARTRGSADRGDADASEVNRERADALTAGRP